MKYLGHTLLMKNEKPENFSPNWFKKPENFSQLTGEYFSDYE
jgi:hypothetical protein